MEVDMPATHSVLRTKAKASGPVRGKPATAVSLPVHVSVLEEARRAGLLEGEKTEHVSFRAPPALVEAAKREAGISSTSDLGILAFDADYHRPENARDRWRRAVA